MVTCSEFRNALAQFATSVTVIATDGAAGRVGVTASSVAPVTDQPPTMLICLNLTGAAHQAIKSNGFFSINLLTPAQKKLAAGFAGKAGLSMEERFALGHWSCLTTSAPILDECQAALDCRLSAMQVIGTHAVLFGQVVAARYRQDAPPLLYAQRDYRLFERWRDDEVS